MVDEQICEELAAVLDRNLAAVHPNHRFYQINPGVGNISQHLLRRNQNLKIRAVEKNHQTFKPKLTEVAEKFPNRFSLKEGSFFFHFSSEPSAESYQALDSMFLDSADDAATWPLLPYSSPAVPLTVFGLLPNQLHNVGNLFYTLCNCFFFEEKISPHFGRVRMILIGPSTMVTRFLLERANEPVGLGRLFGMDWKPNEICGAVTHSKAKFANVFISLFFEFEVLAALPAEAVMPRESSKAPSVPYLMFSLVPKPDIGKLLPRHLLASFSVFVNQIVARPGANRVIPTMESFLMDIGPALIKDRFSMADLLKDLTPEKYLTIFRHFREHPMYSESIYGKIDDGTLGRDSWLQRLTVDKEKIKKKKYSGGIDRGYDG